MIGKTLIVLLMLGVVVLPQLAIAAEPNPREGVVNHPLGPDQEGSQTAGLEMTAFAEDQREDRDDGCCPADCYRSRTCSCADLLPCSRILIPAPLIPDLCFRRGGCDPQPRRHHDEFRYPKRRRRR